MQQADKAMLTINTVAAYTNSVLTFNSYALDKKRQESMCF